jgi:predicted RNA binding protein YcfA (HicA-like mRNA interferase family)
VKLPRDLSGPELAKLLEEYGYRITLQTGSHIRLTSNIGHGEHHITIPNHNPLKVGTLGNILNEVASYLDVDRPTLVERLFG